MIGASASPAGSRRALSGDPVHYVGLDMERVVAALGELAPVEQFAEIVRRMLADAEGAQQP